MSHGLRVWAHGSFRLCGRDLAGHGDDIVICDANFPGFEVSTKVTSGHHIQLAGVDLPEALEAILSVYPLDFFVAEPAKHMAPTDGPLPPLGQEV